MVKLKKQAAQLSQRDRATP